MIASLTDLSFAVSRVVKLVGFFISLQKNQLAFSTNCLEDFLSLYTKKTTYPFDKSIFLNNISFYYSELNILCSESIQNYVL
jgi:hypothetical protein